MSEGMNDKWFCSRCGFENNGKFCCQCGAPKPEVTADNIETAPAGTTSDLTETIKQEPQVSAVPLETIRPPQSQTVQQPGSPVAAAQPSGYSYSTPNTDAAAKSFEPEDNKKATILCIVSLGLMFAIPLICSIITVLLMDAAADSSAVQSITMLFGCITAFSPLAALALMIYTRIRYPKSRFGKILMWIYIAIAILVVIGVIVVFATCMYEVDRCAKSGLVIGFEM